MSIIRRLINISITDGRVHVSASSEPAPHRFPLNFNLNFRICARAIAKSRRSRDLDMSCGKYSCEECGGGR